MTGTYMVAPGLTRAQCAPVAVVDVAQQARELQLALSIPDGLEVAQLLEGFNIPVSDLHIRPSSNCMALTGPLQLSKIYLPFFNRLRK